MMNEIDIFDEMSEAIIRFGKALGETLSKVLELMRSLLDVIDELEPYQIYELLHPRKKPRGSIRRARKRGKRR